MSVDNLFPDRGAIRQPFFLEVVRELTIDDLEIAATTPVAAIAPPLLQKLTALHHRQAQLLASGKTIKDVSLIVGTTSTRLQQLMKDPSFCELMAGYQDEFLRSEMDETLRLRTKVLHNSELATDELTRRLEDDQHVKAIPAGELRKIAESGFDRTVLPPKAQQVQLQQPTQITLNIGPTVLKPPEPKAVIDLIPEPKEDSK